MPAAIPFPRKRRTRGHVIADQAINHVERFVYAAGFTVERVRHDYGYDLYLVTYDRDGFLQAGQLPIQVKASERLNRSRSGTTFLIDIDVAHLNAWLEEFMPVVLILYEASTRSAYWLYVQRHFSSGDARRPQPGAARVRVAVPKANRLNRRAIAFLQRCKENVVRHGAEGHHG